MINNKNSENGKNSSGDPTKEIIRTAGKVVSQYVEKADPLLGLAAIGIFMIFLYGVLLTAFSFDGWREPLVIVGPISLIIIIALLTIRLEKKKPSVPTKPQPEQPQPAVLDPTEYTLETPQEYFPPSDLVFGTVRSVLEETRNSVFTYLNAIDSQLLDEHVRANIFYPEYGGTGNHEDYQLKIYDGFHFNMNCEEEIMITFKPNQGATGYVFESGKVRVTKRFKTGESGSGGWHEKLNINKELAKIIHPDLKWIISMPLKEKNGSTIGVLNVDGLKIQFNRDILYDCIRKPLITLVPIINKLLTDS